MLIAFAIIPFGPTIYPHAFTHVARHDRLASNPSAPAVRGLDPAADLPVDFGLIFYFAVLTLANYGGTIAGWASYNKWALLGGLRSSSQMMSYEVAMGLSLMGAFLVAGTLEPGAIAATARARRCRPRTRSTGSGCGSRSAFVLFFTAAIAETKRAPFDIPEGEPEIIGYFVEYSGIRWGMFFLAEFIEIVFISRGHRDRLLRWLAGAVPRRGWLPLRRLHRSDRPTSRPAARARTCRTASSCCCSSRRSALKVVLLCWFQLMIRWTLPRFRADQLMNLGWKLLLPLSLANIMVTALIKLIFMR